jgi:Ser/Thr protein kinase RdoA (MazF antagonist)
VAFDRLRGRKLTYHDRHTLADWPAVVLAELDNVARRAGFTQRAAAPKRSWQPDLNDEEAY